MAHIIQRLKETPAERTLCVNCNHSKAEHHSDAGYGECYHDSWIGNKCDCPEFDDGTTRQNIEAIAEMPTPEQDAADLAAMDKRDEQLLAEVVEKQHAFWDAVRALEQALGFDLDDSTDFDNQTIESLIETKGKGA